MVCFEDGKITGTEVKGKGIEATDTPTPCRGARGGCDGFATYLNDVELLLLGQSLDW
jgi:hypothetical protein